MTYFEIKFYKNENGEAPASKLENGNANPTLALLQRLAEGMDMTLKLEFIPKQSMVAKQ